MNSFQRIGTARMAVRRSRKVSPRKRVREILLSQKLTFDADARAFVARGLRVVENKGKIIVSLFDSDGLPSHILSISENDKLSGILKLKLWGARRRAVPVAIA